jgi:NitT/TauT family transport system substrate-binding protein
VLCGVHIGCFDLFAKGEIDAFLAHPPDVQQGRRLGIGHVLVSSTTDRPWSQYFCCMLAGNSGYIRKHPVATISVLHAMLTAADICSSNPLRGARRLVERRLGDDYDTALQTLSEIPYGKWRELGADPVKHIEAVA